MAQPWGRPKGRGGPMVVRQARYRNSQATQKRVEQAPWEKLQPFAGLGSEILASRPESPDRVSRIPWTVSGFWAWRPPPSEGSPALPVAFYLPAPEELPGSCLAAAAHLQVDGQPAGTLRPCSLFSQFTQI